MNLIDILTARVVKDDRITYERLVTLTEELTKLDKSQAITAYKLILAYKKKFNNERRVGDSESDAPYYAEESEAGLTFTCSMMPEPLLLILEQFVLP